MAKIQPGNLIEKKKSGEKIRMLTAYDCPTAMMLDQLGIEMILVGDSMGNVLLGHETTIPVTMDDILHHTQAVCRGVSSALVVADMPFMSYQVSIEEARRNAGRLLKEGGAKAVKVEWTGEGCMEIISSLVQVGIPVMGHIGLTPQSVYQLGGYKVQGRDEATAQALLNQAKRLEELGCFSVLLELLPQQLAKDVTESIAVPTIGIGAGPYCDGQVLVTNDLLGMGEGKVPKFVKQYATLRPQMEAAVKAYMDDVATGQYPDAAHSFD